MSREEESRDTEEVQRSQNEMSNEDTNESSDDTDSSVDEEVLLARRAARLASQKAKNRRPTATTRTTSVGTRAAKGRGSSRSSTILDAVKYKARGVTAKPDETDPESPKAIHTHPSVIHSTIDDLLQKGRPTLDAAARWISETVDRPHTVRVASPLDDVDIATLRLSVFTDFNSESRNRFCARSCQAISQRRSMGSVCMVAESKRNQLVGSAECSYHEFSGTRLGKKRSSIWYITEVAVHPAARRKGVASDLLRAIDEYATGYNVETLFLHVDVCNAGAIALYHKAGYRITPEKDPVFFDFTKSLNLHPGATKGRDHYLMYKDLRPPSWQPETKLGFETELV